MIGSSELHQVKNKLMLVRTVDTSRSQFETSDSRKGCSQEPAEILGQACRHPCCTPHVLGLLKKPGVSGSFTFYLNTKLKARILIPAFAANETVLQHFVDPRHRWQAECWFHRQLWLPAVPYAQTPWLVMAGKLPGQGTRNLEVENESRV